MSEDKLIESKVLPDSPPVYELYDKVENCLLPPNDVPFYSVVTSLSMNGFIVVDLWIGVVCAMEQKK